MYERPQYMTPHGYKRGKKTPSQKKTNVTQKSSLKNTYSSSLLKFKKQKGISKEAAKLIAQVIKGMLHQ